MPDTKPVFMSEEANKAALNDFAALKPEVVEAISVFWTKHYLNTGHKFLGRLLVQKQKVETQKAKELVVE